METARRSSYIHVTLTFIAIVGLEIVTTASTAASPPPVLTTTMELSRRPTINNNITTVSTAAASQALVLTTTMQLPQRPTIDNKTCGQSEIDIVIMLDSSTSVGNDNYQKMTNFCKAFLKNADLDSDNIRVGVLSYSTFVHVEFHLNDCNTTKDILGAIDAIHYRSGATNTADGLKMMRTQMFTAPNSDRYGVTNKVLNILTDGVSNINPLNTITEAEQARADGIHIFSIGIGLNDTQELNAMASVPASENSFSLQDFDELAGLSGSLFNDICLVPSDSTAAAPATVLTTTLTFPQKPTRNKNNMENTKGLDMLNTLSQFAFWIYILFGFGSCLVLVFIIWLCWFCLRSKNTKVSNIKH